MKDGPPKESRGGDARDDGTSHSAPTATPPAPGGAAAASTPTPDAQKKPHKKRTAAKGRFRKLWRRAARAPGLASRSEWRELVELHAEWNAQHADSNDEHHGGGGTAERAMLGPLPGPSVVVAGSEQQPRDFRQTANWQATEGSHHRDLLMHLLFGKGGGNGDRDDGSAGVVPRKKKKRKASPTAEGGDKPGHRPHPPASWSSVANLGSVGGVAVIEIEIVGGETDAVCPLLPSQRIAEAATADPSDVWSSLLPSERDDKVKRAIGAACKVKFFQGNKQPRCASDALMFLPPPPAAAGGKKGRKGDNIQRGDLLRMEALVLTPEQLESEGFPVIADAAASDEMPSVLLARARVRRMAGRTSSVAAMQSAPEYQLSALELVSALSIPTGMEVADVHGAEEPVKEDDSSNTEHYVQAFERTRSQIDGGKTAAERRQHIFALDCEMVRTSAGPELARVSVVLFIGGEEPEEESRVVLDELVKPRRAVLDYLTEYSGITADTLHGVETRIEHIQLLLLALIDGNNILVGHSLENDLLALRFVHHKVVDTSVLFRRADGRKFGLRHLSNVLLGKKIQQGSGSTGHCSAEDAEASLVLALRRARHGSSFGLKESAKRQNILGAFQAANRGGTDTSMNAGTFAERNEGCCVCIGPGDWTAKYASGGGTQHVLSCDSIMNSMSMAVPAWLSSDKASKRAGFLWARLRCEDTSVDGNGRWSEERKKLDEIMQALVHRVPHHTPILLVFQRNFTKAAALTQQRGAALNPKASAGWTSVQEDEWQQAMRACRHGEAVWIGSTCPHT